MLRTIARWFSMVIDCVTQLMRQPRRPPEHISTGTVVKCSRAQLASQAASPRTLCSKSLIESN